MVSVPCVMTMPAMSGIAAGVDAPGQLEPDLVVHVLRADVGDLLALSVASFFAWGTAAINCSTPTWPEV